jgi:hypothetical protein
MSLAHASIRQCLLEGPDTAPRCPELLDEHREEADIEELPNQGRTICRSAKGLQQDDRASTSIDHDARASGPNDPLVLMRAAAVQDDDVVSRKA